MKMIKPIFTKFKNNIFVVVNTVDRPDCSIGFLQKRWGVWPTHEYKHLQIQTVIRIKFNTYSAITPENHRKTAHIFLSCVYQSHPGHGWITNCNLLGAGGDQDFGTYIL